MRYALAAVTLVIALGANETQAASNGGEMLRLMPAFISATVLADVPGVANINHKELVDCLIDRHVTPSKIKDAIKRRSLDPQMKICFYECLGY